MLRTGKLIAVIKPTYNTVKTQVQIAGRRTEEFDLRIGIKHGDSLSMLLFINIMYETKEGGANLGTIISYRNLQQENDLLYLVVVVLMANSRNKMQTLINISTEENRIGKNGNQYKKNKSNDS